MVDFDGPSVLLGLVTEATASLTSHRTVTGFFRDIAAPYFGTRGADPAHALAHRVDIIILLGVVIQAVGMERVRFVTETLLDVETVVFHIFLDARLVHEAVILLGTIARIGDDFWETRKEHAKGIKVRGWSSSGIERSR